VPGSALTILQRVVERSYFGWEMQDEWERAELRATQRAERMRDRSTAARAYLAYVHRWAAGDAVLPELVTARRALIRLARTDSGRTTAAASSTADSLRPR
jgi:hypothetical protein